MGGNNITSAAREAGDSRAVEVAARIGYVASGVMHLVIGWLAVQLAMHHYAGSADQSGALQLVAGESLGRALLWVGVVGFLGLGLWQLTEAALPVPKTSYRVKCVAKGITYLVLAWSCLTFARGGTSSSRTQSVGLTKSLLGNGAGRILLVLVGLAIVGVGVYHVMKGWQRKFLEDLTGNPGETFVRAGQVGYVLKGVALAVVGGLFASAALSQNAAKATGLDGAMRTILQQPFGRVLLVLVGIGFAAYGLYSFARARYARV